MNLLQTYLQDISKYPQLSPQEELTLTTRARQGDMEARNQLIHAHLSLVVRVAKVYMPPCDEIMDLIQEGNIGLIYAVDKFDPTRGTKFSTYAFFWINKHIQRFLNHEPDDLVSLDMELTDSSEYLLLSDTIADRPTILGGQTIRHIDTKIEHEELQRQIHKMLSTLSAREREVIRLLYGMDLRRSYTVSEVAKMLRISKVRVCQLRDRALTRMHDTRGI
jgi:RNA polymerase sigma factor (sigma-70 family)